MVSNHVDAFQHLAELETQLGVNFKDKSLLLRALTHRSYINESPFIHADNERLEFLGDAVIDLIVARILYQRFPEQREGVLTPMRARLVRRETLARFAREIHLGDYLLMGKGERESGGAERDATLCATFEALCGALYLDSDLQTVTAFLIPLLEPELRELSAGHWQKDAKSRLQEWSQAEWNITPRYRMITSTGPDHDKKFTVEVTVGDRVRGVGEGNSKQKAAQAAAQAALDHISKHLLL
ncbi:MAG: ribonuclease III [Chloroflexi bacterium]|nr:ribonuclease III [Chloroflexota bacterium]